VQLQGVPFELQGAIPEPPEAGLKSSANLRFFAGVARQSIGKRRAITYLKHAMPFERLLWIAVISGPLVIVGMLFPASWRRRADLDYPSAER